MASDFDITRAAASVYAESLLQLAVEAGAEDEIDAQLRDLRELWNRDPGFAAMMSSAAIDVNARRATIRRIFGGGRVHRLVLNLLLVMNDKRRSMILPRVCSAYRHKLDARKGREATYVTSAVPLSDEQRARLRAEVKRITHRDADLIETVDAGVLGGLRVLVAGRLYDLSISRRLRDLRSALAAATERHLLAGVERFVKEA